jgi:hypothetical protein
MAVSTKGIKEFFAVKLYLATWLLEVSQGESLTKANGNHRLLSYFHTKEKEADFDQYCKTGTNKNNRKDENILSKHRSRP